jgi:uncharacterized protein (DUF2267 family)
LPDIVYKVRAKFEVLKEALSNGEIDDIRQQLPENYQRIFGLEQKAAWTKLNKPY